MPKGKDGQAPQPQRRIEFVKPPTGTMYTYSNHIGIGHTAFDVRLIFGEITDVNDERAEITQRVQVTMSWLEAKALQEWLGTVVKQYEDYNGQIKTDYVTVPKPPNPSIPHVLPTKPTGA